MHLFDPGAKSAEAAEETNGIENVGIDTEESGAEGETTAQEEA